MKTSSSISNISKALLKAQKNIGAAKKGSSNPFFKSTYADLGSVLEAIKDSLNNEGIVILQPHSTELIGDQIVSFVETTLLHGESGEFITSRTRMDIKEGAKAIEIGSQITYMRRYSLQSLVSLPSVDDDGSAASKLKNTSKPALKKTAAPGFSKKGAF